MTLRSKIYGKNIIFFSVQTFNLEKEIKRKLEELGANVSYYCLLYTSDAADDRAIV
ncbi:hypothetical protein [Pedobacter sp. ASV28]|uniref:hypothetical protein n=1 Tax=Pedobacter sp. ASV28 TaxID=2795123 RepID=UPI0018EDDAE6|nr:hypothetical protein [Pedobacter sp. ASV28]